MTRAVPVDELLAKVWVVCLKTTSQRDLVAFMCTVSSAVVGGCVGHS